MKETNKQLLDALILGERSWTEPDIVQAMAEDASFAEAVHSAKETLGVLGAHAPLLDDVNMEALPVSAKDRTAAIAALSPSTRAPILRHGFWLIPSAAAAVLAFSYMQGESGPQPVPSNATLGGASQANLMPQKQTGYRSFNLATTLQPGMYARIEIFGTELDMEPLFTSGKIKESLFTFTAEQSAKLQSYERVWVVVEWVQQAGHSRSSGGQWWLR